MSFPSDSAGTRFLLTQIERAVLPCRQAPFAEALGASLHGHGGIEAYARSTKPLVSPDQYGVRSGSHAFVQALNLAYDGHYPFVLSPDMVWLLIAQGFAQHLKANAEALRHRLVPHPGRARLTVRQDEFVLGFAGNDWEGVFSEFSAQIREHIGPERHRLIVREFTTTGIVERAAFAVTQMDALQSFFDYELVTRCGIPEFTLEGTSADWESLRQGAAELADYDLTWWTEHLLPVLDQFVAASRGEIDQGFWESFYKLRDASGGSYLSGHILNLFPYLLTRGSLDEMVRNPALGNPLSSTSAVWPPPGVKTSELPTALSVAPITWKYYERQISLEFVAGFIGASQNTRTLALRPEIGWAVCGAAHQAL